MILTYFTPFDLTILFTVSMLAGFALVNLWRAAIRRREQRSAQRAPATRQPWIQMRIPDDQR